MKIVHVITGLEVGGAETMLLRLLSQCDRQQNEFEVISLTDLGPMAKSISALGVPVKALGLRRDSLLANPWLLFRLAGWLRNSRADLVQTWMYHANVIGGIANKLALRSPLIWSIRQTNVDTESIRLRTSLIAKGAALLSRHLPDHILYNSDVSRRAHAGLGYDDVHASVIANGFDLDVFKPDAAACLSIRAELGLTADTPLLGLIARYDPQKDHATFIAAAEIVLQHYPRCHFLLAGKAIDSANRELVVRVAQAGLGEHVHLLGYRDDIPQLNAALDIACSSSMGEGFPNTIGEAMACAIPCVVTDVGDSARLVGDTGNVAPPLQPEALAEQMISLLAQGSVAWRSRGLAARERIAEYYSLSAITAEYNALWRASV
jgi:glycosyltransferase involved in cell wall biosynthesis